MTVSENIDTTVSSLVRISLADALCREAGARSDCCTNMDKWLKHLHNDEFLTGLAYLGDIFSRLNLISDNRGSPQPYSMYEIKLRL